MKMRTGLLAATLLGLPLAAEEQSVELDDVVVVATGHETKRMETPHAVYFFGFDDLHLRLQAPTLTEALDQVPGIMLQKTGHGMTSPYLRGLTSQRVVLIEDGVRLNNSFLREGPNQYWNQVDPFFYKELDVMMGPAGVLYGSDAIGGVVYARSQPLTRGLEGRGLQWIDGEALFRYASAEHSFSEHLEGEVAYEDKWSLRLGLTRQDFGELVTGDHVHNPNTNYEQWSGNARLKIWLDPDQGLTFGYNHFDQDDIDRVHRTVDHQDFHGTLSKGKAGDLRRVYDHDRRTVFGRYERRNGEGPVEEVDLLLFYTYFAENYVREKTTTDIRHRFTDIDTAGLTLRLQSPSPWGVWNYGVDFFRDWIDSAGWNIDNGVRKDLSQGVVADDSRYSSLGVYVQNELDFGARWSLLSGVRYTYVELRAGTVAFTNPDRIGDLAGRWDAVTASVRTLYRALPEDELNLFAGVSQGFRAPNLSDTTREDDFGGGQESPTADLDAEHFTTFEVGAKHRGGRSRLEVTAYYTLMKDRIGRLTDNGNATKRNLDNGYIRGVEAVGSYDLTGILTVFGRFAWQEGREDQYIDREIQNGTDDRPVARMQPLTSEIGLRATAPDARWWLECAVEMAKPQHHLADAEKTDNRFPPNGTPGYAVVNVRGGRRIDANTDLAVAVENVGDKAYRIHGSGVNEPGRNLIFTIVHRF
ncbi:MAG: TonB-dependent receptor [Kiritimatiellaeota bacterium]|nr:TonB-dependent receptor [Kiritimatiellota bacterium]